MATTIVTKNNSTASAVPLAADLVQGELAVNVTDKRLFTEDSTGTVVELGINPSTITVAGTATLNGNTTIGNADTDTITQVASYVTGTQLKSAKTATNTLNIAAYDVDGAAYTNLVTLTASNTPTLALTSTGVGTINNMSIGATTRSTGAFTTLDANGNVVLGDADTDTITANSQFVNGTQLKSAKVATNTLNLAAYDTDGAAYTNLITLTASTTPTLALTSTGVGTLDNITIGGTTRAAGNFTTLNANGNVTLGDAAADTVTVNGTTNFVAAPTIGGVGLGMGFKNRIINGAMMIDQRNAGASVSITTPSYVPDRFNCGIGYSTGHTAQRSTTAPSNYTNSLLITVGTGASPTAGQIGRVVQGIEGFNVADLGWGTATAATITLSFWVRSSLTGTFAGGIYNNAGNRAYVFTYTISAANTWEQKTVTIAGDTSGTWTTDNTAGMYLNWDLGTGSTYQAAAGSWAAGVAWATSTSVKLAATSGATFYITGVQLEKGSTATSFDYRPYGTELAFCQRYYEQLASGTGFSRICGTFGTGVSESKATWLFKVSKRATPTMTNPNGQSNSTDSTTSDQCTITHSTSNTPAIWGNAATASTEF